MKVGWKRKIEKRGGEERSGRRGEERILFQELLLLNYSPLAPSGGQGQNNMSIKKSL